MLRPKTMRRWGWRAFGLMWIPFITLMISMLGMPEGSYAWSDLPALTRYSLVGLGFFFAATFVLLIGATLVGTGTNRHVLTTGRSAEATIVDLEDTGTTINQNPLVRLVLDVQPSDQPAFRAETERVIPRLQVPQFQPGAVVEVKYDPESQAVAVVDAAAPDST